MPTAATAPAQKAPSNGDPSSSHQHIPTTDLDEQPRHSDRSQNIHSQDDSEGHRRQHYQETLSPRSSLGEVRTPCQFPIKKQKLEKEKGKKEIFFLRKFQMELENKGKNGEDTRKKLEKKWKKIWNKIRKKMEKNLKKWKNLEKNVEKKSGKKFGKKRNGKLKKEIWNCGIEWFSQVFFCSRCMRSYRRRAPSRKVPWPAEHPLLLCSTIKQVRGRFPSVRIFFSTESFHVSPLISFVSSLSLVFVGDEDELSFEPEDVIRNVEFGAWPFHFNEK